MCHTLPHIPSPGSTTLQFPLALLAGPALAVQTPVDFNVPLQTTAQLGIPAPSYPAGSTQLGVWNGIAAPAVPPPSYPMMDTTKVRLEPPV